MKVKYITFNHKEYNNQERAQESENRYVSTVLSIVKCMCLKTDCLDCAFREKSNSRCLFQSFVDLTPDLWSFNEVPIDETHRF